MPNHDEVELQIMLGIVRIIENRHTSNPSPTLTLTDILQNLPDGISIGTIIGAIVEPEGMQVGDSYRTGQAVNVGPGGTVSGGSINQWWSDNRGSIDLSSLANELGKLRGEARARADGGPQQDEALGALASAERAAEQGDGPGAFESLRKAGIWALEIGKQVGVPVAVKALETALGLAS